MGAFAGYLRNLYAVDGRFPNWTDDDLRDIVPSPDIRQRLLDEMRPQPLAFWEEAIPVFDGWPDAPCGYLQFSPAYDEDAEQAGQLGWPVQRLDGGHFQMLVSPAAVADCLVDLLREMRITDTPT